MLRRRIRATFRWGYMPSALALVAWQSGCDPKWRELKEGAPNSPDQGQARLQPAQDQTPSNTADAVSSSSDGLEVVCSDGDCPQVAGAVDSNDTCRTGDDAGTCSPLPLCEADAGSCEATCPGCFVDGSCVAGDAVKPGNPCLICNPDLDPRGWSNNDGVTCDDGLFCTTDDACRSGACGGAPRDCDDGVTCNGISTCLEDSDSCSAPVSQCGTNAVCDVATNTCRSTCDGCVISGVCVLAGAEAPGNPCQVCDPTRAATGYTIAAGKSCGAAATSCSGQDTCDGQGRCQPNNLPANTACGNPNSSACDQPDACDGNGNCQQRGAANGTPCDDGAFCTTGDQCQGGQCGPTGQQNCGTNRTCNEAANQCQCQGCQIGNTCFAAGATNATNPCQVCDPNRSPTAFSANQGAQCGSGPTECSGQDTCNAQAQCVPNDRTGSCTSLPRGSCQSGVCVSATLPPGASCTQNNECSSGRCETWYRDRDGDGFGTDNDVARTCGSTNGSSLPPNGYVRSNGDCCDLDGTDRIQSVQIFPGQSQFFDISQGSCPNVGAFDYNCSGSIEYLHQDETERGGGGCAFSGCNGVTVWDIAETGGSPPACGGLGSFNSCVGTSGTCTAQSQGREVNFCH
jgi:hypothetical protein